jgi:hypothetical protein
MPRIGVAVGRLNRSASRVTGVCATGVGAVGAGCLGGAFGTGVFGGDGACANAAMPIASRAEVIRPANPSGRRAIAVERPSRVAHTPFMVVSLLLHGCAAVVGNLKSPLDLWAIGIRIKSAWIRIKPD